MKISHVFIGKAKDLQKAIKEAEESRSQIPYWVVEAQLAAYALTKEVKHLKVNHEK